MKVALISPDSESEKALSKISQYIVNETRKKGVDINLITYTAGSLKSFFKIIPKLKEYDIIHLQHEYNLLGLYGLPFFLVLSRFFMLNKKIVLHMHTVLSNKKRVDKKAIKSIFRKMLYFFQNRMINWVSDMVLVNEEFYKNILIEEYNFNDSRIKVVPQGLIYDVNLLPKSRAKKELKFTGNVYLMMGNLTEDVGADIIISQADKIGKTIVFATNPKGVNVRNKEKTRNYISLNKEIVKEKGFEKFVRFDLKEIPDVLWWKYFSAADLIIQAYRGGVRSGVFSDAMSSKTPVVASNIPFFKEMARKYGSLRIAENKDDFPRVIKESMKKDNYKKMVRECERYLRENNWPVVAGKYKELYISLIGNKSNNQ
ncbi:MAG: glycosyltransferase [archaeon]